MTRHQDTLLLTCGLLTTRLYHQALLLTGALI